MRARGNLVEMSARRRCMASKSLPGPCLVASCQTDAVEAGVTCCGAAEDGGCRAAIEFGRDCDA